MKKKVQELQKRKAALQKEREKSKVRIYCHHCMCMYICLYARTYVCTTCTYIRTYVMQVRVSYRGGGCINEVCAWDCIPLLQRFGLTIELRTLHTYIQHVHAGFHTGGIPVSYPLYETLHVRTCCIHVK